jgi:hypothetical protein
VEGDDMAEAIKCERCGGTMEEGFVLDRAHYSMPTTQQWVEGEPKHSFWSGLETDGKRQFKVATYRCDKCGRLESFARESAD